MPTMFKQGQHSDDFGSDCIAIGFHFQLLQLMVICLGLSIFIIPLIPYMRSL